MAVAVNGLVVATMQREKKEKRDGISRVHGLFAPIVFSPGNCCLSIIILTYGEA